MKLRRLVLREIRLRQFNFILGAAVIAVAVALIVAHRALLAVHDAETRRILHEKETGTIDEMASLEDDTRKIMKKLGYNLLILPVEQSLEEYYAGNAITRTMPEDAVDTLARSGIEAVRHLLPFVEGKITWPEQQDRTIFVKGIRGEQPIDGRSPREPMMEALPDGMVVAGSEIAESVGLGKKDALTVQGRTFEVDLCLPEQGSRADVTLLIGLAAAQELLGRPGRISGILALKCHCAESDLDAIRAEIGKVLPGVRVIALRDRIVTRAEGRDRARIAADRTVVAERENRARLRAAREELASWLIPLVLLAAVIWVGFLSLMNARERRSEIGLLRAVGFGRGRIASLFLGRALLFGLAGAIEGWALGFAVGILASGWKTVVLSPGVWSGMLDALVDPVLLGTLLVAAPLTAALASLVPALSAARRDPARVLREE